MRKLKQLTLALLLVTIAFAGCKKETGTDPVSQKPLNSEDIKLSSMVKSFTAKMQSPLKTEEIMGVDSAVWYMKVTANYTYGEASAAKNDVSIQEVQIPLDNSTGYITMEDVGVLYDAVIDSVRSQYYGVNGTDKALSYVNIAIDTIHTASAPDAYQLNVTSVVTSNIVQIPWSFGTSDNWWWADLAGKCDGTNVGKDAMTQLQYMFQIRLPQPSGGYWIPEFDIHENAHSFPVTTNPTNINGYYMFYNAYNLPGVFHQCIPYNEMNFYLDGLEVVGNTKIPQKYPASFWNGPYYCIGVLLHKNIDGGSPSNPDKI
jgi:hypothetical protein